MDKAKKKRIKRYLTWAGIACLVAALTVLPLMAKTSTEADGPVASILSARVEAGSIRQVLSGGGTLTSDAVDVKIPDGVKITEFLVKNGDHVTAGTPVAQVDKVTVLAAMEKVEDTLEYLRDKIQDAKDETVSSTVPATTGGRIKKIFAQEGESVQEVMLRDGALALLSVDSQMAVRLEVNSTIGTGESVDVTLSDGDTVTGRVESNLNGAVTVTIEDEGYAIGETVRVQDLGEGTLYVHNAWKATAYTGTIHTVNVKEETEVSSGATLFTLEDISYNGQLEYRLGQHQEYEALLQELIQMYDSGTILAPYDGVISGVDKNSAFLLSAQGLWSADLLTADPAASYQIRFLSSITYECSQADGCADGVHDKEDCVLSCTEKDDCKTKVHKADCPQKCDKTANCNVLHHEDTCLSLCKKSATPDGCTAKNHQDTCIHKCSGNATQSGVCEGKGYHYLSCIESCDSAQTETGSCDATGAHKTSCIHSCIRTDVDGACKQSGPHYLDCIESCTNEASCPATKHLTTCPLYGVTYRAYAGKVDYVGTNAIGVYCDPNTVYTVKKTGSGWEIVNAKLNETSMIQSQEWPTAAGIKKDDIVLYITGYKIDGTVASVSVELYKTGTSDSSAGNGTETGFPTGSAGMPSSGTGTMGSTSPNASVGTGGGISGMTGGFSGYGNYNNSVGNADEGLYDLNGDTLLTIIPQEVMTISITLDEQDISKVSVGMEATVKVGALRDREYTAQISKVGFTGENNGGSSKYTVELTLDVDQDMLDGMSTTAQIVLETKENIPVIPLAALNGDSTTTFVYTALDKETGEPANPVEVETGLSDGENVEILSGLEIGDEVYYHYYDVLTLDTSA